jgi:hypothetical protein
MIAHIPARVSTQVRSTSIATNRPRRIDPVAGRSLVILAHAIEYLADEYSHQHEEFSFCDAGLFEALQLLMRANRQIYYECPVIPPVWGRICSFVRAHISGPGEDGVSSFWQSRNRS